MCRCTYVLCYDDEACVAGNTGVIASEISIDLQRAHEAQKPGRTQTVLTRLLCLVMSC